MTIESMKNIQFPERTYDEWKQAAVAALKGKDFDKVMKTRTIEDITLEPLYTESMLERTVSDVNAQTAAVQSGKFQSSWIVAQEIAAEDAEMFLTVTKEDLARGNEAIVYTSAHPFDWTEVQLEELAALIVRYPIYFKLIEEQDPILRVFELLTTEQQDEVQGVIFAAEAVKAPAKVRTELIDTLPTHNAGGTIIHELGVALSMMAESLKEQTFEQAASKFWVRFAVDTHFFQEIAKIRAFRILWQAFGTAYGEQAPRIPVFTETSVRSYSKLDPYVNLLRAGNATFSAVLAGTDGHTVHPHDFLTVPTASSRRIARNVQLVIKEESHVSHVTDAAGGSYFIESLTRQYVDAAWNYFCEIQEAGGYSEVKRTGWLTDDIQAKWLEREQQATKRKTSLIGTNVYANPQEPVKDSKIDAAHLEYMTAKRLSTPFEKLRAKSRETSIKSAIILLEPLKAVKPQADFVSGFLSVAGIEPEISPYLSSADEVNRFIRSEELDYAVLCGSQDTLAKIVPGLKPQTAIDVAGKVDAETMANWEANGIRDCLYAGKPLIAKLKDVLSLGKEAL
ncbi:methylmalonyl-CoA mutase family protein [Planococcus sp. ISL-109]|uniref:methylmalonyl-CoA mutase family protein n=1 Tax=Planococcus sp. ISL-109 TaxID=2819166 RepID=UPI001BE7C115|nr:methylmalonyl-CoA mutase family protein [Planococcus sp. ISL-109]MBT2582260.1 methylmalonyl-CoA mutase [Planococcus sp. ISL-109]